MSTYLVIYTNEDGYNLDLFVFALEPSDVPHAWAKYYDIEGDFLFGGVQEKRPDGEYLRIHLCPNEDGQRQIGVNWENIETVYVPLDEY